MKRRRFNDLGEMKATFVNGIEFKEDLAKLVAHYEALPEEVLKTGLIDFAAHPPEDTAFLSTRLWDKHLPGWREIAAAPKPARDPAEEKQLIEESTGRQIRRSLNRMTKRTSTGWITRPSAGWCIPRRDVGFVFP